MDRKTYREAFDQIPFSAGFQERTADLLRQRARELEKEKRNVKFSKTKKLAVTAAAAVALLVVSVSAALVWLTPSQVAELHGQDLLAEAFEGPDAIEINETVETGDFAVTLMGLVSGEDLDAMNPDPGNAHTYAVLSVRRLDGEPLDNETFDFGAYTMTPLVAGCSPTAVNSWTLNAGASGFAQDGLYYYLLDTESIEMFADRTVYMAFYEGGAPNNTIFTVNDDGAIDFCDDFTGVHALFTLPLDPAKADPAAAEAFLEENPMGWTNERTGVENDFDVERRDTEDGEELIIRPKTEGGEDIQFETAESFAAYVEEEKARLREELEAGILSQENYEKSVRDLEEALEGVRDGSLAAAVLEGGGLFTTTTPAEGTRFQVDQGTVTAVIGEAE